MLTLVSERLVWQSHMLFFVHSTPSERLEHACDVRTIAKLKIIFFSIKCSLNERRETGVVFVCCKTGKKGSVGTPGKGIFPVSCLPAIAWSDEKLYVHRNDRNTTCSLSGIYIYIYIYIQLTKIPEIDISLYRDDGLAVINQTPQKLEKIKNEICKIFAQNNLRITIEANK